MYTQFARRALPRDLRAPPPPPQCVQPTTPPPVPLAPLQAWTEAFSLAVQHIAHEDLVVSAASLSLALPCPACR